MATNITISTGGTTTVVTVPSVSNNVSVLRPLGGSTTFTGLTDTPSSFTASKFLQVNSGGTAIDFVDNPGAQNLGDLNDASTSGGANGDVLVRNSSGNYTTSQNLQELRSLLKTNTGTTTLTGDGSGSSTDDGRLELTPTAGKVKFATNSEMELTSTTAKLKTGVTELKLTETSPGDIEFVVATDASGSTAFTAVHIDGTTTANEADVNVHGKFYIHDANNATKAFFRLNSTGNVNLSIPTSSGTLALTSDITAAPVDSVNGETGTVVLDTDDISEGSSNLYYTDARVSANSSVAANTAKNTYPSADATKLAGIEANADVTDAANVAAAGALMDSEVTNLAQVKAFDSSDYATAAQGTTADSALQNISEDTSPQLGGNLDVNGNDIVSTSNADIELDPNGTGKVVFKGNSDKGAGQFVLNCEQNSHGIVIKGPPHSAGASYTLTLPNTDGSANEVLKTDGSGNLDWVAQTDTNLGSTDQTLSGTRNIDMGSNFLTFKSGGNLRMQYDPNDDRFEFNNGLRVNGSFVTADGGLNAGLVKFNEPTQGGTNGVILRGPSTNLTSDVTFVLPDADGSAGQFLKTDGGGNLSFASAGGSGSTTFLGLTDTPSSFTASKFLKVNSAGNAVEFVDGGGSGISNVVEDTTPQLGGDLDTNGKNVLFAKTANTDNSSNGDIVKIGSGSTTQGELCYYTSSGTWVAADADATGTAGGVLLAIALGTDPDVDGMLLRGMYTLDHDPGTVGDELYVSTTAGDITSTAPSGTGDIVRVVGYCLDSTNGQIWFNPSNDFIELA